MNRIKAFGSRLSFTCASLIFSAAMLAGVASAQQPDNTKNNQGDASAGATTADKQAQNPADRELTKKIRRSIMHDKSLSTYAQNIKVITQDGKVTLRGPVRSKEEKSDIEAKAVRVAGRENVINELKVADSK